MKRSNFSLKGLFLGLPLLCLSLGSASAVIVEFDSTQGYVNGTLNGQTGGSNTWRTSSNNANYTVNATGGYVSLNTATSASSLAGYNQSVTFAVGTTVTTAMDFQITQNGSSISGTQSQSLFGLTYATGQASGGVGALAAGFQRQVTTADAYRLTLGTSLSQAVSGSLLGISGAGDTSDVLRLTLDITFVTATTYNSVATLYNVTTGSVAQTVTGTNLSYTGTKTLFGTMAIAPTMAGGDLTNASVLRYSSPVPEPGTYALAAMGLAAVLFFGRRKRAVV